MSWLLIFIAIKILDVSSTYIIGIEFNPLWVWIAEQVGFIPMLVLNLLFSVSLMCFVYWYDRKYHRNFCRLVVILWLSVYTVCTVPLIVC